MEARRQGRPPTIENARDRILDDASALFAKEGYDGTSLGELAEAIGVTKAAIYHYFPNKKEIYEAIIVRTLQGLLQDVSAAVARAKRPEKALSVFMRTHADYFERHYDAFLTMLVGYGGMENVVMIAEAQKLRGEYDALLRRIIGDGMKQGAFAKTDVGVTSRAILSMLNWMVRWFKPGKGHSAAFFADEYHALIVSGIRKR